MNAVGKSRLGRRFTVVESTATTVRANTIPGNEPRRQPRRTLVSGKIVSAQEERRFFGGRAQGGEQPFRIGIDRKSMTVGRKHRYRLGRHLCCGIIKPAFPLDVDPCCPDQGLEKGFFGAARMQPGLFQDFMHLEKQPQVPEGKPLPDHIGRSPGNQGEKPGVAVQAVMDIGRIAGGGIVGEVAGRHSLRRCQLVLRETGEQRFGEIVADVPAQAVAERIDSLINHLACNGPIK